MTRFSSIKTSDLQHERLIHLLVTLTFGVVFVITSELAIVFGNLVLGVCGLVIMGLLIPYIWYYFKLENEVQARYKIERK